MAHATIELLDKGIWMPNPRVKGRGNKEQVTYFSGLFLGIDTQRKRAQVQSKVH